MTNPMRAELSTAPAPSMASVGHAAESAVASESENVRGPKSAAIAITWLWALTTYGQSTTRLKRSQLVATMQAPWLDGGMGMTESAAYRRVTTMVESGCWEQLGPDILFAAPAADHFPCVGNEPPPSLYSLDPSKDKGSKAKEKDKVKGELSTSFEGSMEQRIAEILDSDEKPSKEALATLIADVLAKRQDRTTAEAVPRRIAEMALASWQELGPEGAKGRFTGRDALRESLDCVLTTAKFIKGPRATLLAALAHRGFDYTAHYARAPPRTPK